MTKTIFQPIGTGGFEFCHPVRDEDFETIHRGIDGSHRGSDWSSPEMQIVREEHTGERLRESDSPWLGTHALIFRERALRAMRRLLEEYGELLPLRCADAEVFVYNPRTVDALDVDESTLTRFSSGRIMMITEYEFKGEVVESLDIFKIPDLRVSPTFVGPRFVDAWRSAGLVGLDFPEVWTAGN